MHETCMFYNKELKRCNALTEMMCKDGKCSFYKESDIYDESGENKEDEGTGAYSVSEDV